MLGVSIFVLNFAMVCMYEDNTLPFPHLVILGGTGVGKSTLADVLLGEDPNCKNCTFPICGGGDSCTKDTKFAAGKTLPWYNLFIIYKWLDHKGYLTRKLKNKYWLQENGWENHIVSQ